MEIEYDHDLGVFRVIDVLYLNDSELLEYLKNKSKKALQIEHLDKINKNKTIQ